MPWNAVRLGCRKRMYGLNLLQTQFLGAAQTGTLPVKLDGNNPRKIKWFHW